ncbi:MAG: hypothetical protein ACJ8AI_03625 [Rhodopila sp.]
MLTETDAAPNPAVPATLVCCLCGSRLHRTVLNLGCIPLAQATVAFREQARVHPLHVRVCDFCLLVQVQDPVNAVATTHPAAASSGSQDQARRLAAALRQRLGLGETSLVVELGHWAPNLGRYLAESGIPVQSETAAFNAASAMALAVRAGRADLVLAHDALTFVRTSSTLPRA